MHSCMYSNNWILIPWILGGLRYRYCDEFNSEQTPEINDLLDTIRTINLELIDPRPYSLLFWSKEISNGSEKRYYAQRILNYLLFSFFNNSKMYQGFDAIEQEWILYSFMLPSLFSVKASAWSMFESLGSIPIFRGLRSLSGLISITQQVNCHLN